MICSNCDQEKNNDNFYKDKRAKSGLCSICKSCQKEKKKEYYIKNKLIILTKHKKCYKSNKAKVAEANRQYYINNKDKISTKRKLNYIENKDTIQIKNKEYYQNNKEKISNYQKNRTKKDIQYRLKRILRSRLAAALKSGYKSGSAVGDLGCSIEYFKIYIEAKFQPEMSWNNYGDWHIDHIIPLSFFNLTNRDELLKACNYTNLQPLWAKENMSKSNKIYGN